jgi:GT2 family glycosyltransferase
MNRGARAARGRFVMLCNPDLIFRPGSIAAMLEEIGRSPDTGGVSPVIEIPTEPPSQYPLLRGDPGLYYAAVFFSGLMTRFRANRCINRHLEFENDRATRDLAWIHGCCGLYRAEALAQVGGGFDERFFIYFEDADLGRSLRRKGWRLRMARGARVLHREDQTCKRLSARSRTLFMESWHKYLRKHHALPYRAVAYGIVAAALLLPLSSQLLKLPCGRAHNLPAILAYARAHLTAPFRDLERERAADLAATLSRLKPSPAEPQACLPSRS